MNLLLDTHVFLWMMLDSARLEPQVAAVIRDPANRVALSAASAWEMAIKESIGKLALPSPASAWVPTACAASGIDLVALEASVALAVSALPWHHRDPFDRVLVAQALQGFTLVTHDRAFEPYGIDLLWT